METDVNVLVLLQEVRELRRQVEELRAAGGRRRLTLTADRERPLLGQPVTVTARLTDGGAPQAGAKLVLTATWGHLRLPGALAATGASLDLRTAADGTARAVLVPPTAEEPTADQTEALLSSLGGIDAVAATPGDAREGLEAMARQYRWEPSRELRGAVDLLFRERRDGLAEAINPAAPLTAWPEVPAAITAHAAGTAGAEGAVDAVAVVHLQIVDWLAAWYAVYLEVSRADPALADELELARQAGGKDADALLDQIYDRVHWYVAGHRGLAGETVGRKVAGDSLRGFTERRLDDLPPETRVKIFQGVRTASRTLAVAGPAVLAGVGQVRLDARRDVTTRLGGIEGKVVALGQVAGRLDGLEGKVVAIDGALQTKADANEVRVLRSETQRGLAAKVDATRFDDVVRGKLDATVFAGFQAETRSGLSAKVDSATFDAHQRAVTTNFGSLQGKVSGFNPVRPSIILRPGGGT
ncbi:MAG TPA: hypothetical protein VKK31_21770 [Thermoanaerobaculia bacterium]|nr:hypothetical protein [Thermoanaerobaculia bacterium]